MTHAKNRILSLIICAIITLSMCLSVMPAEVNAWNDMMISETLNIAEASRNMRGPGYEWANRTSELTLSGVNIYTDSAYGLRLPKDCTVILEGDNYIKADKYGISCAGTVVFKGNGTLTIDAGKIGIYLISQNNTHKIRLIEGTQGHRRPLYQKGRAYRKSYLGRWPGDAPQSRYREPCLYRGSCKGT